MKWFKSLLLVALLSVCIQAQQIGFSAFVTVGSPSHLGQECDSGAFGQQFSNQWRTFNDLEGCYRVATVCRDGVTEDSSMGMYPRRTKQTCK